MATHDSASRLRLYHVRVAWNESKINHQGRLLNACSPQLSVTHVKLLDICHTSPQLLGTLPGTAYAGQPEGARLAQLLIIPPAPESVVNSEAERTNTILAVFNYAPSQNGLDHAQRSSYSVVSRWELQQSELTLHESFKALKGGNEKPPSSRACALPIDLRQTIY